MALLALRSVPLAPERMELTLPAEPLELGSLRRALRRWLAECEASETESYDIILACNEACANAIEHAYGPGDASVQIDAAFSGDEVAITVRDYGPVARPARRQPRPRARPDRDADGLREHRHRPRHGHRGLA